MATGRTCDHSAYADDLLQFLDAMGLERVHLLGDGTGALLALQFAQRYPGRVASLIGRALPDAPIADAALDDAFPPFEPRWDGGHLARLWAYLREENAFDPWHPKRQAHRRIVPLPTAQELNDRVVQLLASGQHGRGYERGLRALLQLDPARLLANVKPPTLRLAARTTCGGAELELLARVVHGVADVQVQVREHQAQLWPVADEWLLAQRTAGIVPASLPVRPVPGKLWSDYRELDGGQIHFHCNLDAPSVPLLIQHDAASSVGTVEPITRSLVTRRSVFAFDLPRSGNSDNLLGGEAATVAHYASLLDRAATAVGLAQVDFYGMWAGGLVGLELAHRNRQRIRRLVMSNLLFHEGDELCEIQENYTPDVSPPWHDGHLLQCWHQMRNHGLIYPWFDHTERGVLRRESYLDTAMIHERVGSLLKAGNCYRTADQAHFIYPTLERLRESPVPTIVATSEWDPNRSHTEAAARAAASVVFRVLDPDFRRWGLSFLDFLKAT